MRSIEESLESQQCRRILEALETGPKTRDQLVKLTKLTAGSVAKHVGVLATAGLVIQRHDGAVSAKQ